jgi:hypothetical protein
VRFVVNRNDIGENPVITVDEEIVYIPEGFLADGIKIKAENVVGGGGTGGGSGGTSIDVTAEVGQTIIVKEIDANGMPTKWDSADYQPRTHWASDMVVIPETTLAVEDGMVGIETDFSYVVGKEYKVKFNGVEYLCTAIDVGAEFGVEFSVGAIGNFDAFAETGDNGIPFLSLQEDGLVFMVIDGSESVTLSVTEIVYNPIPAQYLTNAFPYYINVDVTPNDSGELEFTCHDTVANVENMLESGRTVIAKYRQNLRGEGDAIIGYDERIIPLVAIFNVFAKGKTLAFKNAFNYSLYFEAQEDGTYIVSANPTGD